MGIERREIFKDDKVRRLMTGYAVSFNIRHRRSGHLFQNRYKSVVCEEDTYLLELTRYIHLNPLRAKLVKNMKELDKYLWTGHSALLEKMKPWPLSGNYNDIWKANICHKFRRMSPIT